MYHLELVYRLWNLQSEHLCSGVPPEVFYAGSIWGQTFFVGWFDLTCLCFFPIVDTDAHCIRGPGCPVRGGQPEQPEELTQSQGDADERSRPCLLPGQARRVAPWSAKLPEELGMKNKMALCPLGQHWSLPHLSLVCASRCLGLLFLALSLIQSAAFLDYAVTPELSGLADAWCYIQSVPAALFLVNYIGRDPFAWDELGHIFFPY